MHRHLFDDDHEQYRTTVRSFVESEVVPNYPRWEAERLIDRSVMRAAANYGIYGLEIPEEFGGAGVDDYRFRVIVNEEVTRVGATAMNMTLSLQDDLVLPYLLDLANRDQKQRWLPGIAAGELIGALAMTEPDAGSDLRGMKSTAVRDGDDWILNGQKTFISSGTSADLVIVAAHTGSVADGRISLLVVEDGMAGFIRGRKMEKIGLHAQDTAELFFEDVRIPGQNLLGPEGLGLRALFKHLPRERMATTAMAVAVARTVFEDTRRYVLERRAFGSRIADFQHSRFLLAELATEIDIAEQYFDAQVRAFRAGDLTAVDAAKGKWWSTELQKRVVDQCLQLHGGYGYMVEYPVARAYLDTRVQTIYGGTTEIMKEIIAREIVPRE
ncbi:acyl-CoA dehydrogenase family protein [Nocardia sp. NPDC004123]